MGHEPLQQAVLAWYDEHGRDLPWRRTRDPYAILVSEVMAQQTQIARVLERYERWLARWPTAQSLAGATVAEVLTEWSGLGYNQRALRLRAACVVVARDGWPRDAAGLRALPGIGPYTAAAVASFAFGERVAAVDTNVRRVAERLARRRPTRCCRVARHSRLEPGRDGARRARLHGPRAALRGLPGGGLVPLARSVAPATARAAPRRAPRFEDTDRWARGRIVAALAAGEGLPAQIDPERLERVLAGLERDGLIERGATGLGLPGAPR